MGAAKDTNGTAQYPPTYGPFTPPPKKHKWRKRILIALGAVVGLIALVSIIAGVAGSSGKPGRQVAIPTASAPANGAGAVAATAPAPSSAAPAAVTEVEFVISGYAPGDPACGGGCNPDVTYGSDSSTHNVSREVNGTVTYKVPFDASAEYYSLNVDTDTASSHLQCKIVATGPGDTPTTVSSGSVTGQGICSAQAAPEDSTGISWDNEQ